jgi:tetratricopeptide (TPR) repeat protein
MGLQRTHYEVIGLSRGATNDEIKKRYRELARKYHPDLAEDKVLGQKLFAQINQAYRVLIDPERRAQYDATIGPARQAPGPGSSRGYSQPTQQPITTPSSGVEYGQRPTPRPQPSEMARILGDAERCVIEGKFPQAKIIAEKIIKIDPNNAKAYWILGDVYANMRETERASGAYRQSLDISPSPLVEAKLARLFALSAASAARTAEVRKPPVAGNGMNGHRIAPRAPEPEKPAGLFGRLIGKRK